MSVDSSTTTPIKIPGVSKAIDVTMGLAHVCAHRSDQTLVCGGLNLDGSLGDGTTNKRAKPVQVKGLTDGLTPLVDKPTPTTTTSTTVPATTSTTTAPTTPGVKAVAFDRSADGTKMWILDSSGKIHVRGTATNQGNVNLTKLAASDRIATISATPSGDGYYMLGPDGGVLNFSNKDFLGSLGANPPNNPIVAISAFTT